MLEQFKLDGLVAVVTGAAGLLGRRHCEALAGAGAHVVAVDLHAGPCEDVGATLAKRLGGEHLAIGADITDALAVEAMRERILSRFGRVDVLVNNAAINDKVEAPHLAHLGAEASRFENYPLDTFRRVMDVSVTGAFLCAQKLAPVMAERGAGSIINVASTYGLVGPDQRLYQDKDGSQTFYKSAAYPTAKAAMLGLTRFLASYYGREHVRANSLSPGGVENGQGTEFVRRYSERTPLGHMATPNDYQGALLFLASSASRYMTGANLVVDGGYTAW